MPDSDDNIVRLDDARPHVFIQGEGEVSYVVPVIVIEDLIKKRMLIADMEDYEDVMRFILAEWLYMKLDGDY